MYSTRLKWLYPRRPWGCGANKRFCHWAFMIMKSIMTGDEAPGKKGNETEMKARSTGKGGLGTMKRKRTKKSMGDKAI